MSDNKKVRKPGEGFREFEEQQKRKGVTFAQVFPDRIRKAGVNEKV